MMPNLLVGDRLVVSKYPYGWSWVSASFHLLPRGDWRVAGKTPQYGDIVIAVPPNDPEDYIKRVIGLPGDRIALVDGRIRLNGKYYPALGDPGGAYPDRRQRALQSDSIIRARRFACPRARKSASSKPIARPCPTARPTRSSTT